jgi:hypothetical protein
MTARSRRSAVILLAAALACRDGQPGPISLTDPISGTGGAGADGCAGLPTAPESLRVDLEKPVFSNPTDVSNPLFPVSKQLRVLFLGHVEGLPLRIEVTTLPATRTLDIGGGENVETLVSQFVSYLDGRIHEVAIDHYAQADDGAVWYFGEDVFNYEDGQVADMEGTWLAGKDGPPAMIMPADPEVGDVWRPENICGLVFEEVTAKDVGLTVDGPRGAIHGALAVEELHMDNVLEPKTFAPDYGEFTSGSAEGDLEALALAVPTDALPGFPPKELEILASGASEIFDAAQVEDWEAANESVQAISAAWDGFRGGSVPPLLKAQTDSILALLAAAVEGQDPAESRQAAIDVARSSLDLQLRHRTAAETDLDLLELWARQVIVDAEAGDREAIIGDAEVFKWIRDRIARDVTPAELNAIDAQLAGLRAAADGKDLNRAAEAAGSLRSTLARTRIVGRPR